MSRFNSVAANPRRTVNYEGETAYIGLDPEQQLYSITACNLLQDGFYQTKDKNIEAILNLVPKCDTLFVAGLAAYLRHEMNLRSTPVVLLAALALHGKLNANMVPKVISRADEIKELLAAWQGLSGKPSLKKIPNALKKGIAACFNKFDGYHFRKYNKQGKESISFKDAIYLTHPKPISDEKSELFKKILDDNLDPIMTWETELSSVGSNLAKKKEVWETLLLTKKLPYMAALRNIRNIITADVSQEALSALLTLISDRNQVLKSKQFPFRWFSAYKQINERAEGKARLYLNDINKALEYAISVSVENIPGIDRLKNESSLIACDVSGSMASPLSDKSSVLLIEIGILLGKMINKVSNRTITGVFGNDWAPVSFGNEILQPPQCPHVGLSTYAHKVIKWLSNNQITMDNLMFFSDAQIYADLNISSYDGYMSRQDTRTRSAFEQAWNEYKNANPKSKIYLFNLASYGNFPVDLIQKDVYMVTGWSPNIFRVLGDLSEWKSLKQHIINCC